MSNDTHSPFFVRALYDFSATDAAELGFRAGDVIEIFGQVPSGWWDGISLSGQRGWIPRTYVVRLNEEESRRYDQYDDRGDSDEAGNKVDPTTAEQRQSSVGGPLPTRSRL